MNLFFVHPDTRNIGNDIIGFATTELFYEVFGDATNVVNIPAMKRDQFGGLVARQVYDMNRLADGVVVGAGNLFENGQISFDAQAMHALRPPMMLMALSHGGIMGRDGFIEDRTDALSPNVIRHLVDRATVAMVRDTSSQARLRELGIDVQLGGCPTLFLPQNREDSASGDILISLRHPMRMCVPPALQWRIPEDVRRMIASLKAAFARPVRLVCHDYLDLEFAAGFPEAEAVYFDNVAHYINALRTCALNVTYRLHAFLPCVAFGTHSIHLSYDERGRSMLETIGMGDWDIDLLQDKNPIEAMMERALSKDRYKAACHSAQPQIAELRRTTIDGLRKFRDAIIGAD
ncbi:hypothetical protein sos41_40290 [Alphaproteobacteria bacterium SO-S41]|nr:hypothetical protein sos41_40290 [Alphaproteobacteria bacterium SO-S41]